MISKPPTIEDVYSFDAYMNTPGVREGLMQRHAEGDPELMTEDTDDGQGVYISAPHGEMIPIGRPIQLAAGPSQTVSDAGGAAFGITPSMGKRRPDQNSNIGDRMVLGAPDAVAGTARGFAGSALGLGGDLEKLAAFIGALASDNQGGGIVDRFGRAAQALEGTTLLPSSDDLLKNGYTIPGTSITLPPFPAVVPAGTSAFGLSPDQRNTAAGLGQSVGELVGDPLVLGKGGKLAVQAGAAAARSLTSTASSKKINKGRLALDQGAN